MNATAIGIGPAEIELTVKDLKSNIEVKSVVHLKVIDPLFTLTPTYV